MALPGFKVGSFKEKEVITGEDPEMGCWWDSVERGRSLAAACRRGNLSFGSNPSPPPSVPSFASPLFFA